MRWLEATVEVRIGWLVAFIMSGEEWRNSGQTLEDDES